MHAHYEHKAPTGITKIGLYLTEDDIMAIEHIYPELVKINMYWNTNTIAYEGTVIPLLEAILTEVKERKK